MNQINVTLSSRCSNFTTVEDFSAWVAFVSKNLPERCGDSGVGLAVRVTSFPFEAGPGRDEIQVNASRQEVQKLEMHTRDMIDELFTEWRRLELGWS